MRDVLVVAVARGELFKSKSDNLRVKGLQTITANTNNGHHRNLELFPLGGTPGALSEVCEHKGTMKGDRFLLTAIPLLFRA